MQVRLQIIAIKRVTRIFWFPSVNKSYVYTTLCSIKCAIAVCLKNNVHTVTWLARALLSNGSVNKPQQQRECFLRGPRRDRCYAMFSKHVSMGDVFRGVRAKELPSKTSRATVQFWVPSSRWKIATESSSTCEDLKCEQKASFMCNTCSVWFSETVTVPAF
jgi:hypothetical protein